MDKNSKEKPSKTSVVRTPENSNESNGNEASSQNTRLPVRTVPKKKESETQNVVSPRKSKLPIKSSEVSARTTKVIKPQASQTQSPTKNNSTAVLNPGPPKTTAKSIQDVNAEEILKNLCKILDEKTSNCKPVEFTHNERMAKTSALEIQEITCELDNAMSKTLRSAKNVGDKCVKYSNELTMIPNVDLEVPKLSEEDFMFSSKTETEYLEHQINECIHDINSSAYEILDDNPTRNLENVEHEINECIDGLTLKIDTVIQPLKSSLNLDTTGQTSTIQLCTASSVSEDSIDDKKYDDLSESPCPLQIVSLTEQNGDPQNNTSMMQKDENDNEDDNGNMESLTGEEIIESIKVDLEKLRSQILLDSEANLNSEPTAPTNYKPLQTMPVSTRTEKLNTETVHSTNSTVDYESEMDEDGHYDCSSNENTTDDKNDDGDDTAHLNILKALTSEFIKVVKSDILCATASSTAQIKRDSIDSEKIQKRYELLKLLNAMEDLFTEKHDNRPKPPDGSDVLPIANGNSIENYIQHDVNEASPKSTAKHMQGKESEKDRLLKVIEALDDFSNEKLQYLLELKSKTKLSKEANSIETNNLNLKTGTSVNSKAKFEEKRVAASPSAKPTYSNGNSDVKNIKMRHSHSEPKYDENQNLPVRVNSKGVTTVKLIGPAKSGPSTSKGGSYQKIMAERRSTQKLNAQTKLSGVLALENEIQSPDDSKSILVLHKQSKFKQLGVPSPSNKDVLNPTNQSHFPGRSSHSLDTGHSNSSNSIAAETQTSFQQIPHNNEDKALTPSVSTECFLFGNPMLSEKIVGMLDTDDMLSGRQVCREWFEAITMSSSFSKKILVYKPMDFMVSWDEFETSGLLRCNYLNICILRCDLREPGAVEFFRVYSSTLRFLALEQCTFSLVTLQRMLFECTNLEHLELNGLPHYIMYSEAVFPTGNLPKCLTQLKTLILNNGPEVYHSMFGVMSSGVGAELSPGFISDFLTSSKSLERVQLTGWNSSTCLSLLKILYHSRVMEKVNHVAFSDVPLDSLDFDHFLLLGLASQNIKLQKLELTLAEPQTVFPRGQDYANLIIREIVRDHSKTLEELILDNCPITEEVFIFEMPKLQKLSIRGTNVSTTDFQRFMPKLEFLNHAIWINDDNPILPRPRSQTYFGGLPLYSSSVMFIFGLTCASLSFLIYQFHPECAAVTFFIVAMFVYLGICYFDLSFQW